MFADRFMRMPLTTKRDGIRVADATHPPFVQAVRKGGRFIVYLALLVLILPKGGMDPLALMSGCVLIGFAASVAIMMPPNRPVAARASILSLVMACALAAYVLFQSWSFDSQLFANPIWQWVGPQSGPATGSISVNPAATRSAILGLVLPFLTYLTVLTFFDRDQTALRLIKYLAAIGSFVAVFGIFQIQLDQHNLLFFEKRFYIDDVTSTFVNRNTAGTFLGVSGLVILCALQVVVTAGGRGFGLVSALLDRTRPLKVRIQLLVLCFSGLASILALFMTTSRGAILSTLIAYLFVIPVLVLRQEGGRYAQGGIRASLANMRRRAIAPVVAIISIIAVAVIFGGRTWLRMEQQPVDMGRMCIYAASFEAFQDSWIFGTGLGTFQDWFPQYRTEGCGYAYAVFLRSHNFFLEGLVGLGVLFVVPVAVFYVAMGRILYQGYRQRVRLRVVSITAAGALLLVSLHGLIDFSMQIPGLANYLAAFLGAATTLATRTPTSRTEGPGLAA